MPHLAMSFILFLGFQGPATPAKSSPPPSTVESVPASQPLIGTVDGQVFISNEVGISMTLPSGSMVASRKSGQNPFFVVRDGANQPAWSLRLESVPSNDPSAESMIRRLMLSQDKEETAIEVLKEEAWTINGTPGHLAWVREKLPNGNDVIFGWLVLPQGRLAGQLHYMVATIITMPAYLELIRPEMEAALGSISLRGPRMANQFAQIEADNTAQILANLKEEDLRSITGHRSYRRIYRPGKDGEADQEVAYSIFTVEAASMGEIKPGRISDMFSPDEEEEGLLVRVHSRVVGDAERGIYMDMLGLYWLAWDMSHEAWTATVTRRQGAATRHEKEFGFRTRQTLGQPRPRIVVIKQDDEINLREPYEWEAPSPWMPRALTWTMGLFLPRVEPLAMSYAFFDHRQNTPQLGTRRDEWSPQSLGDSTWILQTWLDDSGLPTTGEYGPTGLIRQHNPDGLVVETTTADRIELIWKQSGLETP
ncbi:MAG: hypothetical protein VX527_00375 [Planctomycetota bacterium]|nr:hypothetical protein [Planctomycetota bacterium]